MPIRVRKIGMIATFGRSFLARFKAFSDIFYPSELIAKHLSKIFQDQVTVSDDEKFVPAVGEQDFSGATDVIGPFETGKSASDSPLISEDATLAVGIFKDEIGYIAESASFDLSKDQVTDQSSVSEEYSLDLTKLIDDEPLIAESLIYSASKAIQDGYVTSDQAVRAFNKSLAESAVARELIQEIEQLKSVAIENQSASDNQVFDISKNLSEEPSIQDDSVLAVGIFKDEIGSVSESSFFSFQMGTNVEINYVSESSVISVAKDISENGFISESSILSVAKDLSETNSISEESVLILSKAINEGLRATDDFDGEASPQDDQTITVIKSKSDSSSASELFSRQADYVRSFEESTLPDGFEFDFGGTIFTFQKDFYLPHFTKVLNDSVSAIDDDPLIVKALPTQADLPSIDEQISKGLIRSFANNGSSSDSQSVSTAKPIEDALDFSETSFVSYGKSASDQSSISEIYVADFSKVLADSEQVFDNDQISFGKKISDSSYVSEIQTFNSSKNVSDSGVSTEADVKSINKVLADEPLMVSSGLLRSQSYSDFDYFSEDYVGQSRSFQ